MHAETDRPAPVRLSSGHAAGMQGKYDMKQLCTCTLIALMAIAGYAQPVDHHVVINEAAYTAPFLHCVPDKKYFAVYAVESRSTSFEFTDTIHCKLHIPRGFHSVWRDIEKSGKYPAGEFNYSGESRTGIRFIFYINGVMISSAYHALKELPDTASSFTLYFTINPDDTGAKEGDINFAYRQMLSKIRKGYSTVYIEANMPSRNPEALKSEPFVTGSLLLRYDSARHSTLKRTLTNAENSMPLDLNMRLKYLADSTMMSHFGKEGFRRNFTMTCLQNPCVKGESYANTMETGQPCATKPQHTCREAVVTYQYVKKGVPLNVKMLVTIRENGTAVYIAGYPFGKRRIPDEKQQILSVEEITGIMQQSFPKDSLILAAGDRALSYAFSALLQPAAGEPGKQEQNPGKRIIEATPAGKKFESGFIYTAHSRRNHERQRVYHFDAVTGELLLITEAYPTAK